jgi:hypothetical protein
LVKYEPTEVLFKRDEVVKFVYSGFTKKKIVEKYDINHGRGASIEERDRGGPSLF